MVKYMILGDKGVGKTTFEYVIRGEQPPSQIDATIEFKTVPFTIKGEKQDNGEYVNLQVWDTVSSQQFFEEHILRVAKQMNGFIIIADASSRDYRESVENWQKKIKQFPSMNEKYVMIYLNKADRIQEHDQQNNRRKYEQVGKLISCKSNPKDLEEQFRKTILGRHAEITSEYKIEQSQQKQKTFCQNCQVM